MRYRKTDAVFIFSTLVIFIFCIYAQLFSIAQNKSDFYNFEKILCISVFIIPISLKGLKKLSRNQIIFLIFLIGCILRFGYALSTGSTVRQHDVFDTNGHFDYILSILNNFKLPETNQWQFYHPPVHHILSAIFLKLFSSLGITDSHKLGEYLQLLTAFYSCLTMFFIYKIMSILNIKSKAMLIIYPIICFHPTFIFISGSLNNDCLSVLFMVICIYFTLKWYVFGDTKDSIILAIFFGLAMETKTSAIVILPAIGFIFLYKLFTYKEDKYVIKEIIIQGVIFFTVSLPLSLAYPLRNLIKFNQPIFYVAKLNENSDLYCGNYNFWERFGLPILHSDNSSLYCDPFKDFNIILYTLKCSVFGEWQFNISTVISVLLLTTNTILIVIFLIFMTLSIFKYRQFSKERYVYNLFFLILWFFQMLAFVFANLQYPFGCTMDFRYIILTIVAGIFFIGNYSQELIFRNKTKSIIYTIKTICILFCANSFLFFTSI